MTELLVKVRGDGAAFREIAANAFAANDVEILTILSMPASGTDFGAAPDEATWLKVSTPDVRRNAWDAAHRLAAGSTVEVVEPDILQDWFPAAA